MLKTRFGFARANSLRVTPILQLLCAAALAAGLGTLGHSLRGPDAGALQQGLASITQSAPVQAVVAARSSAASAMRGAPVNGVREAELDDGQTFAELLSESGASSLDAAAAMNALSRVYDLRLLRAGQSVTLSFQRTDQQEVLTGATFQPEATKEVAVSRNAQGLYTASVKPIPVSRQRIAALGVIHSSLFEAGDRASVPHAVMAGLIRIYSHDIDFQRDIHPGDRFEVLYDQSRTAQGKAVGEGEIVYAALNVGGRVRPIYRVMFSDRTVDYFDDRGQSDRRAILRTPVAAAHITSGFGMRIHPLLGYSKMHKGVDFGAPIGTPIFAAGTGTIEEIGFKNGYGRYIRIRHNGTLATAYAHMSRFGDSMHQGSHVTQGEVIGYVGMSGRATGPHLHFEVHVNGVQVNPMSVNLPTGRTLEGKLLADFKAGQARIRQDFVARLPKAGMPDATPPAASPAASPVKGNVIEASASSPAYGTHPSPSRVAAAAMSRD